MTQLYRLLPFVQLPTGASPLMRTRQYNVSYASYSNFPLMYWPNAIPCHLVNLWLMEIAQTSTGNESAKTSAVLITHLVRFCFARNISFYEFNDSYFTTFTNQLKNEVKINRFEIARPARSGSQTLSIQHASLNFLIWLQKKHPSPDRPPIIGLSTDQPGIVIQYRFTPHSSRPFIWHPELVSKTTAVNDKFPMPEKYIAKLRNAVFERYQKLLSRTVPADHTSGQSHLLTLKYLYSRRMFTINMMTNFGLRPEELEEMPVAENSNLTSTLIVVLPTKKTRTTQNARRLKINMGLALVLQAYFDDRAEFLQNRLDGQHSPNLDDVLLLGKSGLPLNKASLTKEFDRLCDDAGLEDRKVCLSMFRHRFISREVKAELLLRFRKNPELISELTPSLKESVSRTVISKTGHRNPSSIWPYVDQQYKLLATPDAHESLQSIKDDLDQTKNTLEDLLFRQNFKSQVEIAGELKALRDYIRSLEERLYAAEMSK
ncbi:hypothetical protein NPS29_00265 [Pseudomonas putida]|uniref:hypothetical protein n=1 Tax=Pseudomonas putida TaxID=303 RepID=UPI002363E78E|nr:hypothetical protein [Pseudomonas putida]MDD1963744.1 hypothetical protein [Pseudomonas putida]